MTDELIEQIKRDREAGTPGPWVMDPDEGPCHPRIESDEKLIAVCGNAEPWLDAKGEWEVNAARIARVPEMEARILSDADEITRLRADLAAAREQVAGAYLAAADSISALASAEFDIGNSYEGQLFNHARDRVLSLTPADATAALEARDARVRAEEHAKVIKEAKAKINDVPCTPMFPDKWSDDALVHYEAGQLDAADSWRSALDALHSAESRKAGGE